MPHVERHRTENVGWLRAAVLGANDGLISTSSLVLGVAAAVRGGAAILLTALAGLVAGALSMAAGEYVSVSSQSDTELADRAREQRELVESPAREHAELAGIYVDRGLSPELADKVTNELMAHDALGAHLRDELGVHNRTRARPVQAALTSAAAFAVGAAPPALLAAILPREWIGRGITICSLLLLVVLGATAAKLGGAPPAKGAVRVAIWGALAMGCTALIGRLFGAVVQ